MLRSAKFQEDAEMTLEYALPLIFMGLMALAMLIYVVLDGYDLGVGMLMANADDAQKDRMVASIGPFWDANETWLVLGVGILLIAFPLAHGIILTALYLPVAFMLIGLILRGVAFDFRVKAHDRHKQLWNRLFIAGSALAALSQGYMLGSYILGFERSWAAVGFSLLIGLCLAAGYCLLGACWVLMKTSGELKSRAVRWARRALWGTGIGIAAVSIATPLVSARIFDKWFAFPQMLLLAPIPIAAAALFFACDRVLMRLDKHRGYGSWKPFVLAIGLFALAFVGLAYSLFPYLVADRMDIWQAASATESLIVILIGAGITVPAILAYTAYSYKVFWGKAEDLSYD
jgi:cytochrome d ubiquinol oxidase subunit II